jgi:hypothetical protein
MKKQKVKKKNPAQQFGTIESAFITCVLLIKTENKVGPMFKHDIVTCLEIHTIELQNLLFCNDRVGAINFDT